MLARLGLRAGEVVTLTLDDIDWRAGEIMVRGKGSRHERLPLPADVGDALAGWLERGRPRRDSSFVFTRLRAPYVGLTSGAVSQLVRRSTHIDIGQFVEWVKERSHLTRGVTIGTQMRDDGFHFTRIGTFLERADSTARILQAHQSDLVPGADAGDVPDPYAWSVLLRALSAFEIYRRVFRDVITPIKVAELLILRDDIPRSLLRCCKEVYTHLSSVANEQSAETERRAGEIHALLHFSRMEEIAANGLPHFLKQFLERLRDLGDRIGSDFLVPPAET